MQKQNLESSTAETLAVGAPGAWGSDEEEGNEIGESQEVESNGSVQEVWDMLRTARGEERRVKPAKDGRMKVRVGDWMYKTEACRGWSNFRWRTLCMKCGKSAGEKLVRKGTDGGQVPGQSPRERQRMLQE